MSPVLQIQRRMMELGRVRLGDKGAKGQPQRLETFRFTSASKLLLDAVAALYGGEVRQWEGAPDAGYFEVYTNAAELNIILPPVFSTVDGSPTTSYSQWFELWSGGGCQRRCDGVTESISGKACACNPDDRECKITTRVSFMLPEIPGLGVWRLESHGWNAAIELPGTLEVLLMAASESRFIPAVLRIEHRTKKVPGEGTRRFIVPVVDLPQVRVGELLSGETPNVLAVNAPAPAPPRPELPAGTVPPAEPSLEVGDESAGWGEPPVLPALFASAEQAADIVTLRDTLVAASVFSDAQFKRALRKDYQASDPAELSPEQAVELAGRLRAKLDAVKPQADQSTFADLVPAAARGAYVDGES